MTKLLKSAAALLTIVAVAATIAAVLTASATPTEAGGGSCRCPAIWDPVICNDGHVYSNACYARCAGARGCIDYPGGPIQ